MKHDELISGGKVARELGVDPATVRRWRKEGAPCHVVGDRLIRYNLDELIAWRSDRYQDHYHPVVHSINRSRKVGRPRKTESWQPIRRMPLAIGWQPEFY